MTPASWNVFASLRVHSADPVKVKARLAAEKAAGGINK